MKESVRRYKRSLKGLSSVMMCHMTYRSKLKGFKFNISLDEFREWLFSQTHFQKLYADWKDSNYDIQKRPSIDRVDNNRGYTFNNIQVLTWKQNNVKGMSERRKSVIQKDMQGNLIKEFDSLSSAAETLNLNMGNLSSCIKGNRKSVGGFKWSYLE